MSILNYNFGWADWTVFSVIFAISAAIAVINGIVTRKKAQQADEFLMGSRAVPFLPTTFSLMASFISSITILGFPADVYVRGIECIFMPIGWLLGGVFVTTFIVPLVYPLKITSFYQYFEQRYQSKIIRRLTSMVGAINQVMYSGLCIYGPSTALEAFIGFEAWKSVLIIGMFTTFPTAIGGLKGVIWMDFFQALVMHIAMIAIIIAGSMSLGGFSNASETFAKYNMKFTSGFSLREYSWYGSLFGGIYLWIGVLGVSQVRVN